jgi:hypothetical protein
MKKIFSLIILILLTLNLFTQTQSKSQYKDFGTVEISNENNNIISIKASTTVETFIDENDANYYRYELILESKSYYNGTKTSTWLYNTKIFINTTEVTKNQFPDGFLILINIKPTTVYWYETYETDGIEFNITWEKSIYETRINN